MTTVTVPARPLAMVIGAGGLGMAVARRLGLSHRLLLADRDAAHLDRQRAALAAEGHDAQVVRCDVTVAADVDAAIQAAVAIGPIAALAHVVGLSPGMGDFRMIMAVDLVGAALVADRAPAAMAAGAAAVFVASSAAHMGPIPDGLVPMLDDPLAPDLPERLAASLGDRATPAVAYMLAKAALIRLCRREAATFGARGMRILSLSPGLIATPQGAAEYARSATKRDLLAAVPLGREGTMLEIADTIEFLLSPRASYLSGIDLLVDGGMLAALGHRTMQPAR